MTPGWQADEFVRLRSLESGPRINADSEISIDATAVA
jgi:hypothetical protein